MSPSDPPSIDQPAGPDPRTLAAEALLHLEWARGAAGAASGGRWMPAATPPPAPPDRPSPGPVSAGTEAAPVAAGRRARSGSRAPELSVEERRSRLDGLRADVAECRRCKLCADRTQTVFGEGDTSPRLVIVGEGPGAEEDRTGRPFVGRAGQLLTKMLAAIGLSRDEVYICNVVKCRPPGNRNPRPDEVGACRPFLHEQLELLQPEVVLSLGSPATRELLRTERGITSLRGRFARSPDGWRVLPTWHPAYLLRNPAAKREAWQDLQRLAAELGLELPPRD